MMKKDQNYFDRLLESFQGCLLGMAVGDVFGAPVEAMSAKRIMELFGKVNSLITLPDIENKNPRYWRLSGLHTDDTQQALTIADSLIKFGELREFHILSLWEEMFRMQFENDALNQNSRKRHLEYGIHRGSGGSIRKKIKYPWQPSQPSIGNGAAMRVAPIPLFFLDDVTRRVDAAIRSALLTHRHPLAVQGTVAVNGIISAIIRFPKVSKEKILKKTLEETKIGEKMLKNKFIDVFPQETLEEIKTFSEVLEKFPDWWEFQNPMVQEEITKFARMHGANQSDDKICITKNHSLLSVVTSILIGLVHLDNFVESIISAVNLGGDTDTVAAITGAITGARCGLAQIPIEWANSVVAKDQILLRARALLTRQRETGWEDLLLMEKRLTLLEDQYRNKFFSKN